MSRESCACGCICPLFSRVTHSLCSCSASVLLLKLQRCDKPSLRKSLLHINSTFFRIPNYFAAMNRKSYPIRIIIRVHQFWLRIISSMARIRNHKRRRKRFPFLEVLLVRAWAKLVLYRSIISGRSSAKIKRFGNFHVSRKGETVHCMLVIVTTNAHAHSLPLFYPSCAKVMDLIPSS